VSVAPADVLRANADDSVIEGGQPSRTSLALSPDGQTVVFSAMAGNRQQLYVRNLDRLEATPIAGTEDGSNPFLSPDGRWVGFWAKGALRKIPLAGDGPPTLICETAPVFGASWSSNDTIVYAIQVGGLWQVAAGGGTPRLLTTLDAKKGDYSHRLPHFLPDGKAVVFTITQHFLPRWDDARLALLTLATGERDDLGPGADARYVPSGHLVFVRSGTLVAAPFQGSTRKIVGSSVSIVGDVMQAANMVSIAQDTGAGQFSVSASGSLMYVRGGISPDGESRVMSVDRRGRVQELPTSAHFYFAPMLSPDATRLILWTRGVDRNVWTYEIAGGTLARLTTEGRNSRAIWTPDGKRVTYTGAVTGADNLFWAPADRSGAPERLTTSANGQDPSSWSPDGATLAFLERVGPDNHDVLTIAPDSDRRPRPILQSHFDETYAEFSPNGHWLAYVSNESGRNEVYVQAYPKPGARHQISTEGGVQPAWSRDGRELFYTTPAPGRGVRFMSVPIAVTPSFTAEAPRMLFEGRYVVQGATRGYDVSADGQRFYVTQARDRPPIRPTQMILVQNWIDELKRRVPTR
jgi:serine/threonine-protein kinase